MCPLRTTLGFKKKKKKTNSLKGFKKNAGVHGALVNQFQSVALKNREKSTDVQSVKTYSLKILFLMIATV